MLKRYKPGSDSKFSVPLRERAAANSFPVRPRVGGLGARAVLLTASELPEMVPHKNPVLREPEAKDTRKIMQEDRRACLDKSLFSLYIKIKSSRETMTRI